MLGRTQRCACLALLWGLGACSEVPRGSEDATAGSDAAPVDGGPTGDAGDAQSPRDAGPETGQDSDPEGGLTDASGGEAGVDAALPDEQPPHVLLRVDGDGPGRAELHAVAPNGTAWRIHEPLVAGGLFAPPRVQRYLPGPRGGYLLVQTQNTLQDGLWVGAPEQGVEITLKATPGFAPGAQPVAFVSRQIALIDGVDGATRRLFALDLASDSSVSLSPADGTLGAYAVAPDGDEVGYLSRPDLPSNSVRLYASPVDGREIRELSADLGEASVSSFFWSGTGELLGVFVDDGPAPSLWVVDREAKSAPVHVATPIDGGRINEQGATFGRNGQRVIYDELRQRRELRSARPGEGPPDVLSRYLTGAFSLSPSDSWVAYFERDTLGDVSAHLQRSDGTDHREIRLAGAVAQGNASEWSHDGRHVVGYASNDASAPWAHTVERQSTRSLSLDGFASTRWISLSPAAPMALVEGRDEAQGTGELFVFDLQDPEAPPRSLGAAATPQNAQRSGAVGAGVSWSSDGRYVFFLDGTVGERVLVRVEVATGARVELTPSGVIYDYALLDDCCVR